MIDDSEFTEAYAELRALHVLSRVEGNGERWVMHRLVRDYGRVQLRPGEVMVHSLAFSEWLKKPMLPLEPEVPHFVSAILDAARYVGELDFNTYRSDLSPGKYIISRSLLFDSKEFIDFIRNELRNPKGLTVILEGLIDINDEVRKQAIRLLESVGPIPEVLEGLISSLSDPDPEARRIAERSLARYGGEKTISILVAATQSLNQLARLGAVRALGAMGTKAHSALKDAFGNDDRKVRTEAGLLLCEQGQQDGSQILIEAIQSVSQQEQRRFIDALGTAKDPKAVPTIRRFLSVPFCRSNAIRALGKIAPAPSAVEGLISSFTHTDIDSEMVIRELAKCTDERTINMLAQTVQGPHAQARIGSIHSLGLMGKKAHKVLKNALGNDDQSVRIEAALLLYEQGQKEGMGILVEAIPLASEQQQRRFIKASSIAKDSRTVPAISGFLSNPRHRFRAIYALREIGDISIYPLLLDLLKDDDDKVRCAVAKSIEQLKVADGPRAIVTSLGAQLHKKEGRESFPALVLEIAERHKIAIPVQVAISFLKHSGRWGESQAKQYCVIVLGQAKATETVPVLIEALGDRDSDVRREVAKALGSIGDPRAKVRLVEVAQKDRNSSVKRAANEALKMINQLEEDASGEEATDADSTSPKDKLQ